MATKIISVGEKVDVTAIEGIKADSVSVKELIRSRDPLKVDKVAVYNMTFQLSDGTEKVTHNSEEQMDIIAQKMLDAGHIIQLPTTIAQKVGIMKQYEETTREQKIAMGTIAAPI